MKIFFRNVYIKKIERNLNNIIFQSLHTSHNISKLGEESIQHPGSNDKLGKQPVYSFSLRLFVTNISPIREFDIPVVQTGIRHAYSHSPPVSIPERHIYPPLPSLSLSLFRAQTYKSITARRHSRGSRESRVITGGRRIRGEGRRRGGGRVDARETDLERGKAGPKEIGREGIHREKGKEREAEGVHTVHTESRVSVFHVGCCSNGLSDDKKRCTSSPGNPLLPRDSNAHKPERVGGEGCAE